MTCTPSWPWLCNGGTWAHGARCQTDRWGPQSRQDYRPSTGWRTPPSLPATGRLNADLLTPRGQQHRFGDAFGLCAWQARICRFDCRMAACQRRIPLSCHRICSPPFTRGYKIRLISAQFEFLGGTRPRRDRRAGAELRLLPPYAPDFNPIEMAFSNFKAFLKPVAARTIDNLWDAIACAVDIFIPTECRNYFAAAGYEPE